MVAFFEDNKKIFVGIISIGILIWSFVTLNCGYYVDENGLLVIYKGIYQGQHMFTDSWEALQTGGIIAWPFYALYYHVLSPLFQSNDINIGLVLYMRICYVITRLLVAVYLYFTIKKTRFEQGAYASAAFYYLFIVVWRNFSYKSICDLAVMLLICYMIRFHETRGVRYFAYAAVATCIAIMAYPTMILLAVFIGVMLVVNIYRNEIDIKSLIAYVVTSVVLGGLFLVYLQLTTGISNALAQISYLGDQDYEHGILYRLGVMLLSYIVFALIAYFPIVLVWLIKKIRYVSSYAEHVILTVYWIAFFLGVCFVRIDSISNSRFIYAIMLLFFWFPYLIHEEKETSYTKIGAYKNENLDDNVILWMIFILSSFVQLVWAISTNQDITVPGHMAEFVVIADILIISSMKEYLSGLKVAVLAVATFFTCFWVPEHNGGYSDIIQTRYIVTEGALKGIALLPEDYEKNQQVMTLLNHVSADDKLLVAFGSNSTGYINSDAWQGTYTVYARTQLHTKLLDYYEINPQNQAEYMLVDEGSYKYEDFINGETGRYLLSMYTNKVDKEGDFVLLAK